jgi:caffeoyl-CoA O-methyltransferase
MEAKKHSDLFLPGQEFARYLYHDATPYDEALYTLVSDHAGEFRADGLKLAKSTKVGFEEMSSPSFLLAFISVIAKMIGAKTILEIGTFIGHSTIQFARMVGEGGHVTTLEVFREFAEIARRNFSDNGYADRITLIEGDAGASLATLPEGSFDLVFIDGNKQNYLDYARRAEKLITEKGVIIIDDVFFHGDALNSAPSTEKGLGCKRVLAHYRNNNKFDQLLMPLRNGMLLLMHRQRP